MVDLFGRPIFESTRARQPDLFSDQHWFGIGYRDGGSGLSEENMLPSALLHPAYPAGFRAGRRDWSKGQHSEEAGELAYRQAKAVGNVA